MAANPPRALSDNVLTITLTQGGQPATTATVVVTVVTPGQVTTLTAQSVPHIGSGVYQYIAGPAVWPTDGTYTVTWNADNGRVLHRVEPVFVSN
jgi:hypothetical protein